MKNTHQVGFWEGLARIILKNRNAIIVAIVALTIFLGFQWRNLGMTYTEANLLPKKHIINQHYQDFLDKFGEEGNLIVIGFNDNAFFTPKAFAAWNELMTGLKKAKEVDLVVSLNDLKKLEKDTIAQKFQLVSLIDSTQTNRLEYLKEVKKELFERLPFYEGLLFNKESGSIRSAVYLKKSIVNTEARKTFILENLVPKVEKFEKETGIDLRVSGMPYIRTINAENMKGEIGLFIGAALFITSFIFFLFFRSFRATFISISILLLGVVWSFGTLGFFHYKITILTAIIPPLIIVIGICNCIFLINKYQQEIKIHKNQAKALQRVISKIGVSTLMTNLTTAVGFATFMITNNDLLYEFGLVTAINVMTVYLLTLCIVPIVYSYMPLPKEKHLYHLSKNYISALLSWVELLDEMLEIQGNPDYLEVNMENISEMLEDSETSKFLFENYLTDLEGSLSSAYNQSYNYAFGDEILNDVYSGMEGLLGKMERNDYTITSKDGKKSYRTNYLIDVTPNIVDIFLNYFSDYKNHYHQIDYYGNFTNMMDEYLDDNGGRIDFRISDFPDSRKVTQIYNDNVEI